LNNIKNLFEKETNNNKDENEKINREKEYKI
jgi:hypothetical protein